MRLGAEDWRLRVVDWPERQGYDAFVDGHARAHPLQLWSWGEVKRVDGWRPLRLFLEDATGPQAAISLVERRLPSGHAFWRAHRGPVVEPGSAAASALWPRLWALARERGAVAVRMDPEWSEGEAQGLGFERLRRVPLRRDWPAGAMQPVRVWRIPLEGGIEGASARLSAAKRRDVRLALRRGTRVRTGRREDLAAFHALELSTGQRKGFPVRSLEFFDRLWQAWNEEGRAALEVVEHEGRVVGGAWWVFAGPGAWGEFVATDPAARALMPAVALYWSGIQLAVERGARFLNFGGIGHRDDLPDGVRAFKSGFGPGDTRWTGEIDLVAESALYRAFRLAEDVRWAWYGPAGRPLRRAMGRLRAAGAPA